MKATPPTRDAADDAAGPARGAAPGVGIHRPCPACGRGAGRRLFGDALPWVVRCPGCGLTYADPQPADAELESIYDEHYYQQFGFVEAGRDGAARGLEATKRATYDRMLAQAEPLLPPPEGGRRRRLLDVGCGLGFSLLAASDRGWDALGLDPLGPEDPDHYPGRRIVRGRLETYATDEPFDLVSLVDVIEHVRDPVDTVRRAAALLRPGGVLLLATNDVGSVGARLLGPRWTHFHRAHLWFFTPESLSRMAREGGVDVRATAQAWRVYNLDYIASILARGENFALARRVAEWSLRWVPERLRALSWPPVPEGFVVLSTRP